jgi:predicted permease
MFMDAKLIGFSLFKLLVIPVLGMLIVLQLVDNEMLQSVCMIMMATPAASITVMLAQQYNGDVEMASKGVALTTVLSVITIPIVSAIVF